MHENPYLGNQKCWSVYFEGRGRGSEKVYTYENVNIFGWPLIVPFTCQLENNCHINKINYVCYVQCHITTIIMYTLLKLN